MKHVELLSAAAAGLGEIVQEVVFTGGAVLAVLVERHETRKLRVTLDADCVVECASRAAYYDLAERLRLVGMRESMEEGAPICRWVTPDGTKVDVMPTEAKILGFTNYWYNLGFRSAETFELPEGTTLRVFCAPVWLACKIEAFRQRGREDFYASHDLEDIVTLLEGRPNVDEEIAEQPEQLRAFLAEWANAFLAIPNVEDIVDGHVGPGPAARGRGDYVLHILANIAEP